jgi:hypothetical protein
MQKREEIKEKLTETDIKDKLKHNRSELKGIPSFISLYRMK